MHMAAPGKKVGYAFSMVNNFLVDVQNLPLVKQSDSEQRPSFAAVPDHAAALASKTSVADITLQEIETIDLKKKIDFFEGFLMDYANNPNGICTNSNYTIFCRDNVPIAEQAGVLFAAYRTYLQT
jgi:hypothetical protein